MRSTTGNLSRLSGMLKSPLARQLFLLFILLPAIEAVFFGVLCYDIDTVGRSAASEFEGAKACQELAAGLESIRTVHNLLHDAVLTPNKSKSIQYIRRENEEFLRRGQLAEKDLKSVSGFADEIHFFDETLHRLYVIANSCLDDAPNLQKRKYDAFHEYVLNSYPSFGVMMDKARKAASEHKVEGPLFGVDPAVFWYIAGVVNLVYLLLLASFLKLRITGPITVLTKSCEKIKSGIAIEAPAQTKTEIGALNESFYRMSLQIAEDKKRRSNYLELLQAIQTTALLKVNAWLETALSFKSVNDQSRRRLDKSKGSIGTLTSILQSMTDALMADEPGKKPKLQSCLCNTVTLCRDAAAGVEALLEARSVKLKTDFVDFDFLADPVLIGRVLINLLSNAIKYSPEHGEIEFCVSRTDASLSFSVKDQGPGISPGDQSKLFKRFSQLVALDGVKRSGTGLGLVICKEVIDLHGGQIGCQSEAGKGSTFWFELPLFAGLNAESKLEEKTVSPGHSVENKIVSVNHQFGTMLLIFICVQVVLFFQLDATFHEAAGSARKFGEERRLVLDTQGLYSNMLLAGNAGKRREFDLATDLIEQAKETTDGMFARVPSGSPIANQLKQILRELRIQHRILDYANDHPEKLLSIFPVLKDKATASFDRSEEAVFRIFTMQRSSFQASYEGQKGLNARVLILLAVAALADLMIVVAVAVLSLRIVEKINLLRTKAEDFAQGRQIIPSLSGNDELTLLDRRLCAASDSIQEAEQQKQELIAVVNHDLRAPLSSILGNLDIITQGVYGVLEDEPGAIVRMSEHELKHLLGQINDLLMLEKIDSGTYELASDKLHFSKIIEESLKFTQNSAEEKGVQVLFDETVKLEEILVSGDKQLLVRLCTILLANAVTASPSHGLVKVALRRSDDVLVAEIENNGTAIDAELTTQIFDRFRFVGGRPVTGMGLPLAYRVCKMHSGSINLRNNNESTVFAINIPLAH